MKTTQPGDADDPEKASLGVQPTPQEIAAFTDWLERHGGSEAAQIIRDRDKQRGPEGVGELLQQVLSTIGRQRRA